LADDLAGVPFAKIVSSPYARALATAAPLAARLGLPAGVDARLSEFRLSTEDSPDWQDWLRATFADPDCVWPGGESARAATARARAAVDAALAQAGGPVAVITHGRLMSLLLASFGRAFGFEDWRGLSNPDVYRIGDGVDRLYPFIR
jgi:2,3-bisphosphoglycerate-dependent phosphoglycerate mutase